MPEEALTKFGGANLPSPAALVQQLGKYKTDVDSMGAVFLAMKKEFGGWVFGSDKTEVADGSQFVVNPYTFTKGWICFWEDGSQPDEVLVSEMDDMPARPPQPDVEDSEKGYTEQRGVMLKCISSTQKADIGMELLYKVTTKGGLSMLKRLAVTIGNHAAQFPDELFPVITLEIDKKPNRIKKYGITWYPNFKVVEWLTAADLKLVVGPEAPEPEEAEAEYEEVSKQKPVVEEARPRRSRTEPVAEEPAEEARPRRSRPEPEPEVLEDEPEEAPRPRQRRVAR